MKNFRYYIVMLAIIASGCASLRPDVRQLKTGLLKQGITMSAFTEVWGQPDKVSTVKFNEDQELLSGPPFMKKRSSYVQQWDYTRHGVTLFFIDDELLSWKTDKSIAELKALSGE